MCASKVVEVPNISRYLSSEHKLRICKRPPSTQYLIDFVSSTSKYKLGWGKEGKERGEIYPAVDRRGV